MILYANGDSHTAGAEAVNTFAFAEDDPRLFYMGRAPHPENAAVAWPAIVGNALKLGVKNAAESASSNHRIRRTTLEWLDQQPSVLDVFVMIQWSTWEREEWKYKDQYLQITASGTDSVPKKLQDRYREFVATVDWKQKTLEEHDEIWKFHQVLESRGIKHVFFNGNNHFGRIAPDARYDWGTSYLGAYDASITFNQWLLDNGHHTVAPESWHFGKSAHASWARFVLQYIVDNNLL